MKDPVLVLGGGPAGLAAAWRLSHAGVPVVLLEQESQVGGAARTLHLGSHRVDLAPHIYHINDSETYRFFEGLCGEDLRLIHKRAAVFLRGKFFTYPFKTNEVLLRLGPLLSARSIAGYGWVRLRNRLRELPEDSFETWSVKRFGKTLYNLCFGNYTERVWGIPPREISATLAQQRVANLKLTDLLKVALGLRVPDVETKRPTFAYPRTSIGRFYEKMAEGIAAAGGRVVLNAGVVTLVRSGEAVRSVRYRDSQGPRTVDCSAVISTMPLRTLVLALDPAPGPEAVESARNLRYRDLKILYLVMKQARCFDYQWIYLNDPRFRFTRVSEQKAVAPDLYPPDRTVLCFEVQVRREDPLWDAGPEELLSRVKGDLLLLGLDPANVEAAYTYRLPDAYPIYDLPFEDRVRKALAGLASVPNVISTGRHGLFLNNDMHDSMEMGFLAADFVRRSSWNSREWYSHVADHLGQKKVRFQL